MMKIDGVIQMGPQSVVLRNAAISRERYNEALGDAIRGGIGGSIGYSMGGDKGAFLGSGVDGVAMSFAGIPGRNSGTFPRAAETEPARFTPNTQAGGGKQGLIVSHESVAAGLPPGFNYLANSKLWRTQPRNLAESIAMNAAQNGGGNPILGTGTDKLLTDPRLEGFDITKYSVELDYHTSLGTTVNTVVHYLKNNRTGTLFDFKFDDRSLKKTVIVPESNTSFYSGNNKKK